MREWVLRARITVPGGVASRPRPLRPPQAPALRDACRCRRDRRAARACLRRPLAQPPNRGRDRARAARRRRPVAFAHRRGRRRRRDPPCCSVAGAGGRRGARLVRTRPAGGGTSAVAPARRLMRATLETLTAVAPRACARRRPGVLRALRLRAAARAGTARRAGGGLRRPVLAGPAARGTVAFHPGFEAT